MKSLLALPLLIFISHAAFSSPTQLTQAKARVYEDSLHREITLDATIPGLNEGFIPQGLTYSASNEAFYLTHYSKNAPSQLSVLSSKSGQLFQSYTLADKKGKLLHGHVGGVTVSKGSIYVSSAGTLYQFTEEHTKKRGGPLKASQ